MTDAAVLRLLASLVFVLLLIFAVAWFSRKSGWLRPRGNQAIRVSSMQSVGSRAQVALVEVEDARLVLGITGNQITLLHVLPPAPPQTTTKPPAASATSGFGAILRNTLKRP